jgi:hypothetical protein
MGATSAASAAAGQAMQGQSGLGGAMVPGIFSSAQQAMQEPSGLAGAMFGLRRAVQQAQQTQQAQQVAAATPEQIAAGNANLANVDYGAEANPTMDQATAVNQTAFVLQVVLHQALNKQRLECLEQKLKDKQQCNQQLTCLQTHIL